MSGNKKIEYWIEGSDYDLKTAEVMLSGKRYLYVGFMCHLSVEKVLKAVFVSMTGETPPYTHNLADLSSRSKIYNDYSERQKDFLDFLQPLNIEARYPVEKDKTYKLLTEEKCIYLLEETKDLVEWIKTKF
jgi:HEPN domain-containing protein